MALRRKIVKSKEQLYMLEVFVNRVTLNPEVSNVNVEDLVVCVRFIDLPEYKINAPRNEVTDNQNRDSSGDSKFGKSCLFAKTPSCLIKAIRWSPLYLELYYKSDTLPKTSQTFLGTAKVRLPACMCKQASASQNETNGLSTPCTVRDTFDLIDPNGKASGKVTVVLRLSCFGSSIVKQFSLCGKSFMLEDSPLQKFLCLYTSPERLEEKRDYKDADPNKPLLRRPSSPPKVSMENPAFKTLTMAEKLNDPKYRELVYRAYPDEPTCCCLPTDRSSHPLECRSGCTRPCCMKLRNPNILSAQEDALADTYCANKDMSASHSPKQRVPSDNPYRLKGGGDIEQIYIDPSSYKWPNYDADYCWYDEGNNANTRLEAGADDKGMSSCSCSGTPVPVPGRKSMTKDNNDVVPIFDACTPRVTSTGATPTCTCPGKETKWPRGAAKCTKQPCMGIDCLIRAFKDAQDFVDSIGKVPGLPGLGLMDPSESPYFGRDVDRDYVPRDKPAQKKKAPPGAVQAAASSPAPTCTAPCSVQIGKPGDDIRSHVSPYAPSVPRGMTVPPRLGIVREAIPVLPEAGLTIASTKHRKKEEKKEEKTDKQKELEATSSGLMESEVGPCGEPRCKSRRKKPPDSASVVDHSATHVSSKTPTGVKRTGPKARRRTKKGSKRGSKRRTPPVQPLHTMTDGPRDTKALGGQFERHDARRSAKEKSLGPGGDRAIIQQPVIPVSRRVMRFVYFVGDYYPGVNFGHRDCIDVPMRVPANMGWLWNTMETAGKLKPRIGWRPGAIGRYLYEMLQDAKEISMEEMEYEKAGRTEIERDRTDRGKTDRGKADRGRIDRGKTDRGRFDRGRTDRGRFDRSGRTDRGRMMERARSAPSRGKSGTRRQRTGRTMSYQSMQKQSKMEGEEEGPESPPTLHIHRKDGTYYVTMYPIRQETSAEPRLSEPMKPLQFKIVKNKDDASVASSSTASDMEIEFSPPAAVTRYRKKPDVIHVDTQVRQQEILDAYKTEEFKVKSRRIRRDKKMKKESKTLVKK